MKTKQLSSKVKLELLDMSHHMSYSENVSLLREILHIKMHVAKNCMCLKAETPRSFPPSSKLYAIQLSQRVEEEGPKRSPKVYPKRKVHPPNKDLGSLSQPPPLS